MEQDDEEKENLKSWLIVLGAFVLNLIIMCPYRLSGLIYVVLIETYGSDRRLAAMPIFMFVLMTSLLGPVTGLVGQKLGPEKTTLLGFLLAVLGFGGVFFAENIIAVIILFGFVYGSGMTLGSSLAPNILRKHFNKNINTANGIVRSGSCIAAFISSPLAIHLFDTYGISGTFLIVAGLMLNGVPVIMLIIIAGKNVKSEYKPLRIKNKTDIPSECKVKSHIKEDATTNGLVAAPHEAKTDCFRETTYVFKTKDVKIGYSNDDEQSNENMLLFNKCNIENYKKKNLDVMLSKTTAQSISENAEMSELNVQEYDNDRQTNLTELKKTHNNNYDLSNEITLVSTTKCNTEDSSISSNKTVPPTYNNDFEKLKDNSLDSLTGNLSTSSNGTFANNKAIYNTDIEQSEKTTIFSPNIERDDFSISSDSTFINYNSSNNSGFEQSKEATLFSSDSSREDLSISSNDTFTNSDSIHNINCELPKESILFSSTKSTRGDSSISSVDTLTNSDVNLNKDCEQSNDDTSYYSSKYSDTENSEEDFNISSINVIDLTAPDANYNLNNKKGSYSMQKNNDEISRANNEQCNGIKQLNEIDLPLIGDSPIEGSIKVLNVTIEKPSEPKKPTCWSSLTIFINPIFFVLMALTSLLSFNLTMVWTTIIDYSRDKGIPNKYEVYILMFHPLFDFVGRVGLTWMVDKGYVGYIMFEMIACLLGALSILGLILSTDFVMLMIYAALFALSTGAQLAIAPGMIFKFLEKEEYMMAMPSRNMLYAPLSFTALPIIGHFRNELKSYDGVYYLVIAVTLICCAITPLLNPFLKARKHKQMKALEMDIVA